MRALVCRELTGIDGLRLEDVAAPAMIAGGVRIRVAAAGLNFADTLITQGKYQIRAAPPFSPGFEVAGTVVECAHGVGHVAPGDRVMAVLDYGGFAEEVVADAARVFRLADGIDTIAAAGFPIAYGTSHLGLTYRAGLRAGETLLVHGAAGGVGLTAVECGKLLGATVIATAGGADKLAVARAAGADHCLDSRADDIREGVKALTGGRGADVVYDPVGGAVFEASLRCTAPGGRILIVGFASGEIPQIPANILMVKNITAIGFYWGAHQIFAPGAMRASFDQLLDWLAADRIKPPVSETFPLADGLAALTALKARRTTGKVVLTMGV